MCYCYFHYHNGLHSLPEFQLPRYTALGTEHILMHKDQKQKHMKTENKQRRSGPSGKPRRSTVRMTQKAWGSVSGPRTPAARSWHTCCQGKHVARIQPLDPKKQVRLRGGEAAPPRVHFQRWQVSWLCFCFWVSSHPIFCLSLRLLSP